MVTMPSIFRPAPARYGVNDAEHLLIEARSAQALAARTQRKLAAAAKRREVDPDHYRLRLRRHRLAQRRLQAVVGRIPRPVRFYLFGLIPVGQTYGVPATVDVKKALVPWWARWALWPRRETAPNGARRK